jgi:hypothetical protein
MHTLSVLQARCFCLVLFGIAASACVPDQTPTHPSPALTPIDSTRFVEGDSAVLGTIGTVLALDDGSYLIADGQNYTIRHFDRTGRQIRAIGRRGRGPGEFTDFGPVAYDGDSLLFVLAGLELHALHFPTGSLRFRTALAAPYANSIAVDRGDLYFRSIDQSSGPRVSRWRDGQIEAGAQLPRPSDQNPLLDPYLSIAVIAPLLSRDTLLVGIQSSDDVLIGSFRGPLQRVPVAKLHRQGSRPDLRARLAADPQEANKDPQLVYTPSVPVAIARLSNGMVAYVTFDYRLARDHFAAKAYLSVVDSRTGRSCPDARIPVPEDPAPSIAIRGDTLIVASQEVAGTTAHSWLRRFLIDVRYCNWVGG